MSLSKTKYGFILPACLILLLFSADGLSQNTFISLGPELALPAKYFQSYNNRGTALGGSFRVEPLLSYHVSFIATLGYISFAKTSPFSTSPTFTTKAAAIPIELGIKYYPIKNTGKPKGFFISAEMGLIPTNTHVTFENGSGHNHREIGFSLAPGLGYLLKHVEGGFRLRYNLTVNGFNVYYYDFRIAYLFF